MNIKNVKYLDKLKKLSYPLHEMLIVGSGTMALYGLKENNDIDLWVTKKVHDKMLKDSRFSSNGKMLETKDGFIEANYRFICVKDKVEGHLKRATIVNGFYFQSLQDVLEWKKCMNRPKDHDHIKIIEDYMKKNLIENYLLEIQSLTKLYHLSQQDLNGKILKPKIPSNIFTKTGREDDKIPRVSFAPTINQCITAIGNNRIEGNPEKRYYVFEPENYNKIKIMTNEEIVRKKLIADAKMSGEIWVISDVKLKEVGVIEIIKKLNLVYQIKDEPHPPFKFYRWKYKVLDGNIT